MGLFGNWELPQLPSFPKLPNLGDIAPYAGAAVGALGGGPLGGIAGFAAGENFHQQDVANRQNIEEAQANRDFQANQSGTAHQREVDDLLKAGLNPVLAANGGASTPGGSQATVDAPQIKFPEFMQAQQIANDKQRVNNETLLATSNIARNLSENQLTRMKTILAQKGMVPAQLEGDAAKILQNAVDWLKSKHNRSTLMQAPMNMFNNDLGTGNSILP